MKLVFTEPAFAPRVQLRYICEIIRGRSINCVVAVVTEGAQTMRRQGEYPGEQNPYPQHVQHSASQRILRNSGATRVAEKSGGAYNVKRYCVGPQCHAETRSSDRSCLSALGGRVDDTNKVVVYLVLGFST